MTISSILPPNTCTAMPLLRLRSLRGLNYNNDDSPTFHGRNLVINLPQSASLASRNIWEKTHHSKKGCSHVYRHANSSSMNSPQALEKVSRRSTDYHGMSTD